MKSEPAVRDEGPHPLDYGAPGWRLQRTQPGGYHMADGRTVPGVVAHVIGPGNIETHVGMPGSEYTEEGMRAKVAELDRTLRERGELPPGPVRLCDAGPLEGVSG